MWGELLNSSCVRTSWSLSSWFGLICSVIIDWSWSLEGLLEIPGLLIYVFWEIIVHFGQLFGVLHDLDFKLLILNLVHPFHIWCRRFYCTFLPRPKIHRPVFWHASLLTCLGPTSRRRCCSTQADFFIKAVINLYLLHINLIPYDLATFLRKIFLGFSLLCIHKALASLLRQILLYIQIIDGFTLLYHLFRIQAQHSGWLLERALIIFVHTYSFIQMLLAFFLHLHPRRWLIARPEVASNLRQLPLIHEHILLI